MKRIFLFMLILWAHHKLSAQTNGMNAISFPTANTNFTSKIGTAQATTNADVDLYTGTAMVNVGICNLASRQLSVPVSINYTGGRGIKLQDYASSVGLGWQLNAGGSITRMVRGYPDEQPNGYVGGGWGTMIAGWTGWSNYSQGNLSLANYEALTGIAEPNNAPTGDGEPDIFYVQTPYFSFQFVLDPNGNAVVSNNNGISVVYNRTAENFVVTDDQGTQYFFGIAQNATSIEQTVTKLYSTLYTFISTWYLDKIVTFNSQDVVTFNYVSSGGGAIYYDTTYHYQFTEEVSYLNLSTIMDSTPQMTVIQVPRYVSSIVSSLGEVDFSYVWDRKDDHNAARLSTITVNAYNTETGANNSSLETYTFNTSYFGTPSTDPNVLRLRLDNITVTPNGAPMPTPILLQSFSYNQTNTMPSRRSGAFDYFGYCSATSTAVYYTNPSDYWSYYSSIRTPNPTMAITCILQSITDITGGQTQIFYEPNDYGTGNTVVGGFRVNKISRTNVSTGETLSRTYYYKDANGYSTGEVYGTFYNQLSFAFGNAGLYFSESPYITTDVNGVFDGYSMVKVTNPDGGNTVYTFTNFNDAPNPPGLNDIFNYQMPGTSAYPFFFASSTSLAYKRGLLKDQLSSTASGNPVSEVTNTYTSQTTPGQAAKAFRPFNMGAVVGGNGGSQRGYGAYYSITDNYRLSQTVRTDYDQVTPTNKTLRTTAYAYSAANHRLVLTSTTTDSKAQTLQQTYYYADDGANDTYVTAGSAEQQALSTMATANRVNVVVDETDSRNGATRRVHNLYSTVSTGLANNIYLTATNTYVGSTLVKQQNFVYDPSSSQLIDVSAPGDKTTAMYYDYNTTYPVAKIVNASWSATYTAYQSSTTTYIMNIPGSLNFTTAYMGSIQLHLLGSGAVNYNLTGPVYLNSVLCNGATGGCGVYQPSYTINNAGVGTYSLSVTNASGSGMPPEVGVTYPSISTSYAVSKEFFYEGFEQSSANTKGGAHTGNMYYPIDYYPNYTPPDSRSYTIQWWSLVNGKWIFNEQPYATGMTLPGPVDDVRIFPSDAQMTTYTYNPLVGKTSEIDPAGRATTYEYDFLGRLLRVRDQDGNILKQYDYQYQVPLHQ